MVIVQHWHSTQMLHDVYTTKVYHNTKREGDPSLSVYKERSESVQSGRAGDLNRARNTQTNKRQQRA